MEDIGSQQHINHHDETVREESKNTNMLKESMQEEDTTCTSKCVHRLRVQLTLKEVQDFGEWRLGNIYIWLTIRVFNAAYTTAILVWGIAITARTVNGPWWPIYLTNWTLVLLTAYFWCAVSSTIVALRCQNIVIEYTPNVFMVTWHLQNVCLGGTMAVFALFWLLVYTGGTPRAWDVHAHGVNWVYVLFSIIHNYSGIDNGAADGTYIYKATDYKNHPEQYGVIVIIVTVILPAFHGFMVLWGKFGRYALSQSKRANKSRVEMSVEQH
mmetsp:Transcript_708/g.1104  ORF Transcript_708/g.1104 Transcript_708/m.1104 type:complete len:269 (+) Transcript_708:127-933(+)